MSLEIKNVSYSYDGKTKLLKNVSLKLNKGEILGLVAPSGYGKSTLGQIAAGYLKLQSGEILVDGARLSEYRGACPVQMAHQHPEQSVNIHWKIKNILDEGEKVDAKKRALFGIKDDWLNRFPTELSGGELQRVCLARILGGETRYLIADEITTMIDAITQVEICKVLREFTKSIGIMFISHDEKLLEVISDRIVDLRELNMRD